MGNLWRRHQRPSWEPRVGQEVFVDVTAQSRGWLPAEVRDVKPCGKRFSVCVNGDEEFVEEFDVDNEHHEWVRASEDEAKRPQELVSIKDCVRPPPADTKAPLQVNQLAEVRRAEG
eukprot:3985789-Prymnesium_polylepis.1